ncbi:MAG: Hsp33 family molecular chaperone HslO [Gammaproteobacteria bacterium]|nr:Hsp33 family molecular chaperone HslO [Gammaproteobacteria bacterium]
MKDLLNRYLFDNIPVRGELVQASNAYQEIIANHNYPIPVQHLLGELLVATSMLTALLKFEGTIAVQLQGDGPMPLAVVNGNDQQELRGVARVTGDITTGDLVELFGGKGYMVISITPKKGERYQGIVALDHPTLAQCLEAYFLQSEQLKTHFWLKADHQHAAGIMIQALPEDQDQIAATNDDYSHLQQLTATIKAEELFELTANDILNRLYHQEKIRIFEPQPLTYHCGCSRERSASAIISIGRVEAEDVLAEQGNIEMHCDYCNTKYLFNTGDVAQLFNDPAKNDNQVH